MRFVVISGMSGAGKTTARFALEDLGYFAVDNLPPPLWPALVETLEAQGLKRAAAVVDIRAEAFLPDLEAALATLRQAGVRVQVVYLEASSEVLLKRYNLTRRVHPLGTGNLLAEIAQERRALAPVRALADVVVDTSQKTPRDLKAFLSTYLGEAEAFVLRLVSFGFKWGPPREADLVLDVRALPNPHYAPKLKPRTGADPEVAAYIFRPEFEAYYRALLTTTGLAADAARQAGRGLYTVAIGCTGGRHRSVATAIRLGEDLASRFTLEVEHRDVDKE
ncbi:RNase adapter RapZ [Marinithermus hydrothermalis]|uniref:UPF0042 nucleotide-binding protein yhbJ n=1 Tax=Marinithermus hydrothermalis (strain DSM 14884 / JCM 11576 / T1) TaxID=869210 RepID=F2NKT0_MARHT|nr:RNase adapter RapZ [Marinithermus hydrothermalis]AEB10843.1 UPF0042 nucleotide-binding protein yhbJ [Marinithermus hydrothermalis DSM 14884]